MRNILIFTYGTLKSGLHNHQYLKNTKFLGTHITDPMYTMVSIDGDFPAVLMNGSTAIHGEVYAIDQETFDQLDELEGYGILYNRIQIDTEHGKTWIYYMEELIGDNPIVHSGNWTRT